jgi:hypothetical protein
MIYLYIFLSVLVAIAISGVVVSIAMNIEHLFDWKE